MLIVNRSEEKSHSELLLCLEIYVVKCTNVEMNNDATKNFLIGYKYSLITKCTNLKVLPFIRKKNLWWDNVFLNYVMWCVHVCVFVCVCVREVVVAPSYMLPHLNLIMHILASIFSHLLTLNYKMYS